jgi:hypothetical protein
MTKMNTSNIYNKKNDLFKLIMQNIDCPMWIMNTINMDGLKICPIVCELPKDELLSKLHSTNQFGDAIVKQIIAVLHQLQGNSIDGITLVDFKPILDNDYDMFIIMFQKNFMLSTQTVVLATKQLDKQVLKKYNNNMTTARIFKDAIPTSKLDLKILSNNTAINIAYFGKLKINPEDVSEMKGKIMH